MATKTFIWLVIAVLAIGAAVGAAAQTLTRGDAEPSILAGAGANEEANDVTPTPDADGEQPDPTAIGTTDDSGWTQADGDTDANCYGSTYANADAYSSTDVKADSFLHWIQGIHRQY